MIFKKCIFIVGLCLPHLADAQVISVENKLYVAEGTYNPGRIYVVNPPKITDSENFEENLNYLIYYPVGAAEYYKPYMEMYKQALEKYKTVVAFTQKSKSKSSRPYYPIYFDGE